MVKPESERVIDLLFGKFTVNSCAIIIHNCQHIKSKLKIKTTLKTNLT